MGLTHCQAKAYLAAIQCGVSTAKKISEIATIARPDIYRVILSLEKLGLIEKSLNKPTLVKAIPLSAAISFLVHRKKQETLKIVKESEMIVQYFTNFSNKTGAQENEPNFILIPEKEAYIRKRREEISNSQNFIDFITSWKRFPRTIYTFSENTKSALNRNVKIRVILEEPPNGYSLPNMIQELEQYPNYQLKYLHNRPPAIIAIFDRKRTIIDTSSSIGLAEAPALWTDNNCLVSTLSDYFEKMWITAMEQLPEQISQ